MGFITPKGQVLEEALLATIKPHVDALQAMSEHAKTPEYREKMLKAFFSIFDDITTWGKDKSKWIYHLSMKKIAGLTGYSDVMVGYYRTLWENKSLQITVAGKPGPLVRDAETGGYIQEEAEPETVKVSDHLVKVDVADLARAIRSETRAPSPDLSQNEKGQRLAKRLLALSTDEQTEFLLGLATGFEEVGSSCFRDVAEATHTKATRKGKEKAKVSQEVGLQATA